MPARSRRSEADRDARILARRVRKLERKIQAMRFSFGFALGAVSGVAIMAIVAQRRRSKVSPPKG